MNDILLHETIGSESGAIRRGVRGSSAAEPMSQGIVASESTSSGREPSGTYTKAERAHTASVSGKVDELHVAVAGSRFVENMPGCLLR